MTWLQDSKVLKCDACRVWLNGSEGWKMGLEGEPQMTSRLQQRAAPGLGSGRAEQSRERSPGCLLGMRTFHSSPSPGLSEV